MGSVLKNAATAGATAINPAFGAAVGGLTTFGESALKGDTLLGALTNASTGAAGGFNAGEIKPFDVFDVFGLPDFRRKR